MQKAARITTLDPQARLAVLLATTGLTQLDLARLVRVAGRTVRRWMEGVCKPPAAAIRELEMLAHTLDEDADFVVRAMGEQGSGAAVLVVYRRDYDVPPSRGLRTVRYHLALVRRVAERRPDVQFVTYDRHPYQHSFVPNLHQIRREAKKIGRNRPTSGPTGGAGGGGAGGVGGRAGAGHLWDHPLRYLS
jgi:transcriptional regulator with XRE-family HTH domain